MCAESDLQAVTRFCIGRHALQSRTQNIIIAHLRNGAIGRFARKQSTNCVWPQWQKAVWTVHLQKNARFAYGGFKSAASRQVGRLNQFKLHLNNYDIVVRIAMLETRYVWDEAKNRSNQKKHGISFEEGTLAFRDPLRVTIQDRIEDSEIRWQTFGMARGVLLLMVVHTSDDWESLVRIISVRRVSKIERRIYENQNG